MNYLSKIILIILFNLFINNVYSQHSIGVKLDNNILSIKKPSYFSKPILLFSKNINYLNNSSTFYYYKNSVDLTEIAFDCNDLATFCRLELKMEKAAKFPVKFRLGEVQYVERMEGKY